MLFGRSQFCRQPLKKAADLSTSHKKTSSSTQTMCNFLSNQLGPRSSVRNIMSCFASRILVTRRLSMGPNLCSDQFHILCIDACNPKQVSNTLPSGFCANALCYKLDVSLKVLSCLLSGLWRQRLAAEEAVHPDVVDDHVVVADLRHGHCHELRIIWGEPCYPWRRKSRRPKPWKQSEGKTIKTTRKSQMFAGTAS